MWSAMGTTGSGRWEVRSQGTQVARSLDGATGKNQEPSEVLWTQKSTANGYGQEWPNTKKKE